MSRQLAIALLLLSGTACDRGTSALPADLERRLVGEGIVRRAPDLDFRFTKDPGGRSERREDRRASIVVTNQSVLIHKNDRIGLHITPRTRRAAAVERSGSRIRIRWGSGRSEEVWSFDPPDDAAGWTQDIRRIITPEKANLPSR